MTNKKLLILGAGEMQIPVIQKANELGYETIVLDYNPSAPGFRFSDKYYEISTLDLERISEIATNEGIDGILTTSDAPVRITAVIANKMGLSGVSQQVSEICTNKFLQREMLHKAGINCPEYMLVNNTTNIKDLNKFPYVVKPIDSSASRGVKKVYNHNDLSNAIYEALKNSRKKEVIVESYIEGQEYSVETLTQNGITHIIAITEKETCGEKEGYFVEKRHIEPARIDSNLKELIEQEVKKVITLIGLDNCPSHTEIKVNNNGVFIVEIACRLGGDYITSDLVPLSTGIDMLENLIKISLSQPINIKPQYSKAACIQFITPKNYEKIVSFINSMNESIVKYKIETFEDRPVKSSLDRLGYVIIQAENINILENILTELE